MALVNYGLFYVLGIVLARSLGAAEFGDYSVAVTAIGMIATFATLGMEKYALRSLTSYLGQDDMQHARGFLQFSGGLVVAMGLLFTALAVVGYELYQASSDMGTDGRAFHAIILFLPVVALTLQLVELATAAGAPLGATLVYRCVLPLAILGFVLLARMEPDIDSARAARAYGAGWVVALLVLGALTWHLLPRAVWSARAQYRPGPWVARSLAFMTNSLLLTLLGGAGILVLEAVGRTEDEVGIFGAVTQTAALVLLVATSTNRFYLPELSVLIDRKDEAAIRAILHGRRRLVGVICVLFLATVVLFGKPILGLFSPEFEQGYTALVVLACGTALNTWLGLAPYMLQFLGAFRVVVVVMSVAAALNVGLAFLLAGSHGALGVAVATTASGSAAFGLLSWMAARRLTSDGLEAVRPE